jgi:hypothetical protein
MEVADPREFAGDPILLVSLKGRTYTLPDTVFLPWFAHMQSPFSVNGWYDFMNSFSSPSTVCPAYNNYFYGGIVFVGVDQTIFTGVSNNHQLTTGYITLGEAAGGFLLSGDLLNAALNGGGTLAVTFVQYPGMQATYPLKVNDRGYIVGAYFDSSFHEHGFLLRDGQYSTIDFPGAAATEALGINSQNNFQIVGDYTDPSGKTHGFIWQEGVFTSVDAPFAADLIITAINDQGKVVGTFDTIHDGPTSSFQGTPDNLSPLIYPMQKAGAINMTFANSINNVGQVIGATNAITPSGFVSEEGFQEVGGNYQPITVGPDNAFTMSLNGNNNDGIIVGNAADNSGSSGLVLVPANLVTGLPFQSLNLAFPSPSLSLGPTK